MFKFDLSALVSKVVEIVGAHGKRMKCEDLTILLAKDGYVFATDDDGDMHLDNSVKVLKGLIQVTTVLNCEVGRSGGIGLTEWEAAEKEVSPTNKLKREIIDLGFERGNATKIVNRYAADLIAGKTSPITSAIEVLAKYNK